jgi:putative ubiquitin-RnfH superfamily antitoxin RatB of RatAB toxin-antitoxin module
LYRPLTRDPKDVRRQRADRHPVGRRRSRRVPL